MRRSIRVVLFYFASLLVPSLLAPVLAAAQATGVFNGTLQTATPTNLQQAQINGSNNIIYMDSASSTSYPFVTETLSGSSYNSVQVTRLLVAIPTQGAGITQSNGLTYCYYTSSTTRINYRVPNGSGGYTVANNIYTPTLQNASCATMPDGTVYLAVGDGSLQVATISGSTYAVSTVSGVPSHITNVVPGYNGNLLLASSDGTWLGKVTNGAWTGSLISNHIFYKYAAYQDTTGTVYLIDTSTQNGFKITPSGSSNIETSWTKPFGVTPVVLSINAGGTLMAGSATALQLQFPSALSFPAVAVGTADPVEQLVLKMTAAGTLGSVKVTSPGGSTDFVDAGTGTCTTNGASHTYSIDDLCTIDVIFNPTRGGARTGIVTVTDAAANTIATASLTGSGIGGAVDHLKFTTLPTSATVGTSFNVSVTAYADAAETTVATNVAGTTATVASSDTAATLPTGATFGNGVATFSITLNTPGSRKITVTDNAGSEPAVTSSNITVATAVNHFTLTGLPSSTTAGTAISGTVTAYSDSGTTVATNYTGPVKITSSDTGASLPANLTLTNGRANFNVTLKTAGAQALTAADSGGTPSVNSGNINVNPGAAAALNAASGSGQSIPVSTLFNNPLQVQLLDAYNNSISGAVISFAAPGNNATAALSATSCITGSDGTCSVTATANLSAGTYNVVASAGVLSTTFVLTNTVPTTSGTTNASVPYNFGTVSFGASATQTIRFNFTTPTAVSAISVVTQGITGKDFQPWSLSQSTALCVARTYGPGESCTVDVAFSPLFVGNRLGAVVLMDASGNALVTAYLGGIGSGALLATGSQTVATIAGTSGSAGYNFSSSNTTASTNLLNFPEALTGDASGNLYVGEYGNHVIRKIAPDGTMSVIAGVQGSAGSACPTSGTLATANAISSPLGMVVDATGNLVVVDFNSQKSCLFKINLLTGIVTELTPLGNATSTSGFPGPASGVTLSQAAGITADMAGNLYVGTAGHILKFDKSLNVTNFAGSTATSSTFSAGSSATTATFGLIYGMSFDATGNLYATDYARHYVYKITPGGVLSAFAGKGSSTSGTGGSVPTADVTSTVVPTSVGVAYPKGVVVDAIGNVYISEVTSGRVSLVDTSGFLHRYAGLSTNTLADTPDGSSPTSTGFGAPIDMFFDKNGNFITSDYYAATVRRVGYTPFVATSLNFSATNVGSISADSPKSVSFTNIGNAPITLTAPSAGKNPSISAGFYVDASSTCPQPSATPSSTVAAGASCTYALAFKPVASGTVSGTLTLSGNVPGGYLALPLTGTGVQSLDHFAFTSSPSTVQAGTGFNVTVTAYSDSGTTIASSYAGPVAFTSTDSSAVFPSALTLTNGVGTFAVTLKTAGTQTLTVQDPSGSPSATSGNISVSAAVAATVIATSGGGQSAVISNAFTNPLVVQTVDAYNNPVGGVTVNLVIPTNGAGLQGGTYQCTTAATATPAGSCSIPVTANSTAGSYTVSAQSGSLTAASFSLTNSAKTSQTITFNNPGAQSFGTTPTLAASSTSSLPVSFTSTTTGVCTITSGGTLTFVTAGTCSVSADQAGNGTYAAATTVSRNFQVNAVVPGAPTIGSATGGNAQATVSFTAPANTGGASITGYTVTSSPGNVTATGTTSPITITGLTNGTPYTFTVTAINSAGPGSASASSNSVTPTGTQTITFSNPGTQTFGTTPTLTATASSGLAVSFTSSTSAVCAVTTGGALTFASTGTCTVNADQSGNSSYPAATRVTQSFTVQAASQMITFANPGAQTYGTTPTVTASSTSSLVVSFTSSTASVCTITSGGALTFVSAGSCSISADQSGNSNYNAAPTVTRSFTVNASSPGVPAIGTAIAGNAQATVSFTAPVNAGGTTITGYTITSSPENISAMGTGSPITVTGLTNGTGYTFTVKATNSAGSSVASVATNSVTPIGTQSITFTNPGSQTYGSTSALSVSASSGLSVTLASATPAVCSVSGTTVTYAATGTCTINADQAGNAAYSAATRVTQSFAVLAASQAITFNVSSPVTYSPSGTVTLTATGGASGNAVTFAVVSGPGTISGSTLTIAGTGTIIVAADQAANSNYNAAQQVQRSIVVNAASQTITFPQPTSPMTYAPGLTVTLSATASSSLTPMFSVVSGPATVSGTTLTITGAGTVVIAADQSGNANYSAAPQLQRSIVVNTASQTITFSQPASPITYGSVTSAALSASGGASGNGVTFSVASGPGTISGSTLTITGAGTVVINADQAGNGNYAAATTVQKSIVVGKASATMTGPTTQPVFVIYSQAGMVPVSIAGQYSGAGITAPSGAVSYSITNSSSTSVVSGSLTIANGAVSVPVANTLAPGNYTITLNYAGDTNYAAATQITASLQVGQIQPTITWITPSALTYGATLSSVLNAQAYNGTSTVAGTYSYLNGSTAVKSSTVLPAGSYMLTVNFAPTDTTTYKTATGTVALTVNKAVPGISLLPSVSSLLVSNPVTLTATVSSTVSTPTGSVTFLDGTTPLGTGTLTGDVASLTTSSLAVGSHNITAVYSSDANFTSQTSAASTVQVNDFNLTISTSSATGSSTSQTVLPGGTATYNFTISPTGATTFPAAVNLTVSGLPTGATYTITPMTITSGAGATNVTLTINVPKQIAMLDTGEKLAPLSLALLLLPFSGRMRRSSRKLMRLAAILLLLIGGAGGVATLTGCGSTTGFFASPQTTYNVIITGTSGALSHSTTVTLTVQ